MDDKKSKAEQKRANQEAAGIPDSKLFIAPGQGPTGADRILNSHINGVLIADLNLPPNVVTALDWHATDEGIADTAANPNARPSSGITLGADPWDKSLEQRRDDVRERDMNLWESRDPLKEVADKYAVPGMTSKFLGKNRVKDEGTTGDYEVVKNAAGDDVKVRGMTLAHIPTEKAQARRRHYQGRGNQLLKQIGEQYLKEGGATAVSDQDKAA